MKRHQNLILLGVVLLLALIPLWLVQRPAAGADGKQVEIFAGADNKAKDMIGQIDPGYTPWFEPLMQPASAEIASLLFALQAALGAGFIGYYLGVSVTRERMSRQAQKQSETPDEINNLVD
ncbi:energy-coupling factor ABC transporter substrate-binding protein [Propionivibrio sp.]|uniref:energy-coupling factor ABC transporter substrate-binding protein n=1 Tax=Propionivibrio sp. TaxID=2212460 RepID=UPI0025D44726|nr:energy-coupling factor ABC transporter substrate-binding protein [Propionivibrio sp.]MBK7354916.1 energy-coupling factor ABC transporter substrate-binding protein [Propionivibrio sp.]MBK8402285.1 energy-coupling factor ABC transporter substrate-binding protein [Propionivibrio sp.]MBK8743443.1 energy-coupling factor ABC transporter substrate-binding protein [Propionivibrio sp.]MBK8892746.1 energy-coupling factor ABC transporter substrate-binding protein [Propionivibrio sp.]MBL0206600.1 energ